MRINMTLQLSARDIFRIMNPNKRVHTKIKIFTKVIYCPNCNLKMYYKALRCPLCETVL